MMRQSLCDAAMSLALDSLICSSFASASSAALIDTLVAFLGVSDRRRDGMPISPSINMDTTMRP